MLNHAWKLYQEEDVFSAIACVAAQKPDALAVQTCADLTVKLYWEQKDLPAVIAVGTCGMALGWRVAEANPEDAEKILGVVKAMAYNLASFTWPGWDEPGIEIGKSDLTIGLAAAKTNLRLAEDLSKGSLPLARAHWMLGAHYMAQQESRAAVAPFEASAVHAAQANSPAEVWLAKGFQSLAELLSGDVAGEACLIEAKQKLAGLEHGPGFVGQLQTAERVFAR